MFKTNSKSEQGVDQRLSLFCCDFMDFDLSEATIIIFYLLPDALHKLDGKLREARRRGCRIVSMMWAVPAWEATAVHTTGDGSFFVYEPDHE